MVYCCLHRSQPFLPSDRQPGDVTRIPEDPILNKPQPQCPIPFYLWSTPDAQNGTFLCVARRSTPQNYFKWDGVPGSSSNISTLLGFATAQKFRNLQLPASYPQKIPPFPQSLEPRLGKPWGNLGSLPPVAIPHVQVGVVETVAKWAEKWTSFRPGTLPLRGSSFRPPLVPTGVGWPKGVDFPSDSAGPHPKILLAGRWRRF